MWGQIMHLKEKRVKESGQSVADYKYFGCINVIVAYSMAYYSNESLLSPPLPLCRRLG